jgi:hypothetical protein
VWTRFSATRALLSLDMPRSTGRLERRERRPAEKTRAGKQQRGPGPSSRAVADRCGTRERDGVVRLGRPCTLCAVWDSVVRIERADSGSILRRPRRPNNPAEVRAAGGGAPVKARRLVGGRTFADQDIRHRWHGWRWRWWLSRWRRWRGGRGMHRGCWARGRCLGRRRRNNLRGGAVDDESGGRNRRKGNDCNDGHNHPAGEARSVLGSSRRFFGR